MKITTNRLRELIREEISIPKGDGPWVLERSGVNPRYFHGYVNQKPESIPEGVAYEEYTTPGGWTGFMIWGDRPGAKTVENKHKAMEALLSATNRSKHEVLLGAATIEERAAQPLKEDSGQVMVGSQSLRDAMQAVYDSPEDSDARDKLADEIKKATTEPTDREDMITIVSLFLTNARKELRKSAEAAGEKPDLRAQGELARKLNRTFIDILDSGLATVVIDENSKTGPNKLRVTRSQLRKMVHEEKIRLAEAYINTSQLFLDYKKSLKRPLEGSPGEFTLEEPSDENIADFLIAYSPKGRTPGSLADYTGSGANANTFALESLANRALKLSMEERESKYAKLKDLVISKLARAPINEGDRKASNDSYAQWVTDNKHLTGGSSSVMASYLIDMGLADNYDSWKELADYRHIDHESIKREIKRQRDEAILTESKGSPWIRKLQSAIILHLNSNFDGAINYPLTVDEFIDDFLELRPEVERADVIEAIDGSENTDGITRDFIDNAIDVDVVALEDVQGRRIIGYYKHYADGPVWGSIDDARIFSQQSAGIMVRKLRDGANAGRWTFEPEDASPIRISLRTARIELTEGSRIRESLNNKIAKLKEATKKETTAISNALGQAWLSPEAAEEISSKNDSELLDLGLSLEQIKSIRTSAKLALSRIKSSTEIADEANE